MPRSIWKGAISFGLVNIPVTLYSAESPQELRFNQLDKRTMSRVREKRVDEKTGQEVPYEDIVKGYDTGGGRYVVLTEDDLKRGQPQGDADGQHPRLRERRRDRHRLLRQALLPGADRLGQEGLRAPARRCCATPGAWPSPRWSSAPSSTWRPWSRGADVWCWRSCATPTSCATPPSSSARRRPRGARARRSPRSPWPSSSSRPWSSPGTRSSTATSTATTCCRVIEEKERTGASRRRRRRGQPALPAEGQVVDIMALLKRSVDEVRGAGEAADGTAGRATASEAATSTDGKAARAGQAAAARKARGAASGTST